MRKWFRRAFLLLPWGLLLVVLSYFLFFEGLRDAFGGRMHRKAMELFQDTSRVNRVELYLLMGDDSELLPETFPILPYGDEAPIFGKKELVDAELAEFLENWRGQEPIHGVQAMCHLPAYGFRLCKDDRLIGETSLCWKCSNFYVRLYPGLSTWYGFNADSESGQALLEFCDARLPYTREEEPDATAESDDD